MLAHVTRQIFGIVNLAFNNEILTPEDDRAKRFAKQLLDGGSDAKLSALRKTLGMSEDQYEAGLFGWKGILYYRWRIRQTRDELRRFLIELNDVTVRGATAEEHQEINDTRRAILGMVKDRWRALTSVTDDYDSIYNRFCQGCDPTAIRTSCSRPTPISSNSAATCRRSPT